MDWRLSGCRSSLRLFDEMRIDRFEGGRIVESWFIPDRLSLWHQLGIGGGVAAGGTEVAAPPRHDDLA
ncbi:MAG: hypothetical protein ACHQ01_00580 [Candidatus Limnocylindrales bacterium]